MTARLIRGLRRTLAPLGDRGAWAVAGLLVAGAAPASAALVLVALGLVVGAALAPVGVGVPVLVGSLLLVRAVAGADRRLLAGVLGPAADLDVDPDVDPRAPRGPWRERATALAADPRTWRSAAWLAVRSAAGLLVALGLLATAVVAVALLAVPFVDGYLAFGAHWRSPSGWASAWTLPVAVVLLVGVAHGFRLLAAAHVRLAELLLGPDPSERLAALHRAVERADSRERLARDLHDGLGHALTLVVVQAQAAATALDGDPDAARTHLQAVTQAARSSLADLDRALDVLHGAAPPERGLGDVPELVRTARAAGLDVVCTAQAPSVAGAVPEAVSAAAYRVVQEGLTNALRHNGSGTAVVSVEGGPDDVRVVVRTPAAARPRAFPGGSGRGLAGLRERVEGTGGTLVAGPRAGEFVVEAVWPRP